jgi:flavin-dependent dehydrogenase
VKKIIIIGGGVAGLGAAYKVRRAAEAGNDVDCVLVEKDARLGGKLATDIVADPEGGEYVVDGGATPSSPPSRLSRALRGCWVSATRWCPHARRTRRRSS